MTAETLSFAEFCAVVLGGAGGIWLAGFALAQVLDAVRPS